MSWWLQLRHIRGSQPRCVSFTHGERASVASRLTRLVNGAGVTVAADDSWLPTGQPVQRPDGAWDVSPAMEVTLDNLNPLLSREESQHLKQWWLMHPHPKANTPNWDIAGTCLVDGQKGILLVEAKAHANELEEGGKTLDADASEKSRGNHLQIGRVISDAAACLQRDTGLPFAISRDQRYQMSNRFAMACKLTEMGYAVVLVYLGFLNAGEMSDLGSCFPDLETWQERVERHSKILFPAQIWGQRWTLNGRPFLPLIRAIQCEYDR